MSYMSPHSHSNQGGQAAVCTAHDTRRHELWPPKAGAKQVQIGGRTCRPGSMGRGAAGFWDR